MYVKVFNHILDSSIADNRKLRHFFIDLLLCSDPDGNVMMTNEAISRRTRADMEEVEWGLAELAKPDPKSNHTEHQGKRIIRLEGHGYGWKIVNYALYRDFKSAEQMRRESADRVRKHRAKKITSGKPLKGEPAAMRALKEGNLDEYDRLAAMRETPPDYASAT